MLRDKGFGYNKPKVIDIDRHFIYTEGVLLRYKRLKFIRN